MFYAKVTRVEMEFQYINLDPVPLNPVLKPTQKSRGSHGVRTLNLHDGRMSICPRHQRVLHQKNSG